MNDSPSLTAAATPSIAETWRSSDKRATKSDIPAQPNTIALTQGISSLASSSSNTAISVAHSTT